MRKEQATAAAPAGCPGGDPADQQPRAREGTPTTKPSGLGSTSPLTNSSPSEDVRSQRCGHCPFICTSLKVFKEKARELFPRSPRGRSKTPMGGSHIFFPDEKECFNEGVDVLHLAAIYRGRQSELQRVRTHPKCTLL